MAIKENKMTSLSEICLNKYDVQDMKGILKKKVRCKSLPNVRGHFIINESRMKTVLQTISDRKLIPLLAAAKCGYTELVDFLIREGADYNSRNTFGMNCLHLAAKDGHYDLAEYLVRKPNFVNSICMEKDNVQPYGIYDGYSALHFAVDGGNLKLTEMLLLNGADVNVRDIISVRTPMMNALKQSNIQIVKLLLKHGANMNTIDKHGNTALHIAISSSYYSDMSQIVHMILQEGVNIDKRNKYGNTALHIACRPTSKLEAFFSLTNRQCNVNVVNKCGKTPLFVAIEEGSHIDIVKHLLLLGADCNVKDTNGDTPLHIACIKQQVHNVDLILKYCSDVNVCNMDSLTPLMVGVKIKLINVVTRLLLSPKVDIHKKNKHGETALCVAIKDCRLETAKLLVKNGADVHVRDAMENTLLHHAVTKSISCVQFVLKCGVDVDAVNIFNTSALEVAVEKQIFFTIRFLLDYKCNINMTKNNFLLNQLKVRRHCREIFYRHLLRMDCLGCNVPQDKMKLLYEKTMEDPRGFDVKQYRNTCMKEIEKMKTLTFEGTCISLYSLLRKNIHQLARCMENLNLITGPHKDFQSVLHVYGPMICLAIDKGLTRKLLLDNSRKHFDLILGQLPALPNCCVDLVLHNLTNRDLQVVIDLSTPAEGKYT